jgi:uncharacterized membrane protein YvlD (DUF360 family)
MLYLINAVSLFMCNSLVKGLLIHYNWLESLLDSIVWACVPAFLYTKLLWFINAVSLFLCNILFEGLQVTLFTVIDLESLLDSVL